MPRPRKLLALYQGWLGDRRTRRRAPGSGARCCSIHAEKQFWTIGTVAGELQPIVVNTRLRNVPDEGRSTRGSPPR